MRFFDFHPAVTRWFEQTFGSPTEPQRRGWPAIQSGQHTLISAPTGRGLLKTSRTLILDEIHAVVDDRRGAHLALSAERLHALVTHPLQRIGLSATQKPIEEVTRFLVGARAVDTDGQPECAIIDIGHQREWDLAPNAFGAGARASEFAAGSGHVE